MRNSLILLVPRDRIELPTRGFSELFLLLGPNNLSKLQRSGCGYFAPFCNLYVTICNDLHSQNICPDLYFIW
jgi:hypothetical protein